MTPFSSAVSSGPERQVVLVVAPQPQLRRVLHERAHHLGLVVPVVRVGELDDLHVLAGHAVQPEHQLDALLLLDAPPVGLDGVLAPREADLLALQIGHPVDVVPGAHHHHAAFARRVRHAQEPGPADVGHDVDGREQAAEADHVVEVVDVVRVPVVLGAGAEVEVVDAELLVLFLGPAQFLVDVAGGHQRAIGVVHLVPIQLHRAQLLALHHRLRHDQFLSSLPIAGPAVMAVIRWNQARSPGTPWSLSATSRRPAFAQESAGTSAGYPITNVPYGTWPSGSPSVSIKGTWA